MTEEQGKDVVWWLRAIGCTLIFVAGAVFRIMLEVSR